MKVSPIKEAWEKGWKKDTRKKRGENCADEGGRGERKYMTIHKE